MSPEHDFTVRNGSHSGARRSALRRVLIVSNPLSQLKTMVKPFCRI